MICYVLAMGKQHLGPHVVVGYSRPFHYVTRSPGEELMLNQTFDLVTLSESNKANLLLKPEFCGPIDQINRVPMYMNATHQGSILLFKWPMVRIEKRFDCCVLCTTGYYYHKQLGGLQEVSL